MATTPKVFISATSGDLWSIRQLVKEALLTINCHPVEQTNFEPDARTVEAMLRGKIGDCQALIHIAGLRYGAEPDPTADPRSSYTQMEYHPSAASSRRSAGTITSASTPLSAPRLSPTTPSRMSNRTNFATSSAIIAACCSTIPTSAKSLIPCTTSTSASAPCRSRSTPSAASRSKYS